MNSFLDDDMIISIWQIENRGMTEEEAEAFKEDVARLGRGKKE